MNHWREKERVNLKLPLQLFACWCTLHVSETLSVSNGWDPDQGRHFVGPDLGSI